MSESARAPIVVDNFPATRKSLRVAFVSETDPAADGDAAPIARIFEGLRARNHELQMIRARPEDAEIRSPRFPESLIRGMVSPRLGNLKRGLTAKRALTQLWRVRRPDLVHIATEGPLGWSAVHAALHLKLPVCSDLRVSLRAYSPQFGIPWLQKQVLVHLRKFHNKSHCTLVPSEDLKQLLLQCGFRNLTVVAPGVDTLVFNPQRRSDALRRTWGAAPDTLVVVHAGRLAGDENLDLLVRAFEAMRRINDNVRFVLIGDELLRSSLRQRCPDVLVTAPRDSEDLAVHYASGDLLFSSSGSETLATPEAMASGLPVLACRSAATQAIRDDYAGALTSFATELEFFRQAEYLAGHPAQLAALKMRARAAAGALSWDHMAAQIESIFIATISAGPQVLPATHWQIEVSGY